MTMPLSRETDVEPQADCALCPRLAMFRSENRAAFPTWFNSPVPSFGPRQARLLIVGLAPGLKGANRTGRPFTGDHAGHLLYSTLCAFGFARGTYLERADDGLELLDCRITNAVRCVPPQNKPLPAEALTCRLFLKRTLADMLAVRAVVALGRIAFVSVLQAFGLKLAAYPFRHGAVYRLPGGMQLIGSYHCSRYNTSTGRLTPAMFHEVFAAATAVLNIPTGPGTAFNA